MISVNEKLNEIKEILKDSYEGKMPDYLLEACANDLYDCLFVSGYPLEEIYCILTQYEMDAEIESCDEIYLFSQLIDLLEASHTTARRLYNSFMYEMDVLDTFLKLVNDNSQYITKQQLFNAKKKAFETFDKQLLEFCCLYDGDDGG